MARNSWPPMFPGRPPLLFHAVVSVPGCILYFTLNVNCCGCYEDTEEAVWHALGDQ